MPLPRASWVKDETANHLNPSDDSHSGRFPRRIYTYQLAAPPLAMLVVMKHSLSIITLRKQWRLSVAILWTSWWYNPDKLGYGGEGLRAIGELYQEKSISVDFELINAKTKNNEQCIRRKRFSLKNGFQETGWGFEYLGCNMRSFAWIILLRILIHSILP